MDMRIVATIVLFFCLFKVKGEGDDGLSLTFYNKTCPQLEKIVYDAMKSTTKEDPHTPAAILRLLFHDCRVEGCDASILVDKQDPDGPEISSSLNFGVRKRELIGEIKSLVDKVCPQQVSCADILVLAARDAVAISGGPTIPVPLGRRDTAVAFSSYNANQNLPDSNGEVAFSVDNLNRIGTFTLDESIALLGAHTLGNSHCITIMDRIWGPPDGIPITPGPEYEFVKILKKICPQNSPALNNTLVPNDRTPRTFDNSFFVNILKGHAVIVSDADMARNRRTVEYVRRYASDNEAFLQAFSSAFLKLSKFKVLTGNKGEIRRTCNKLNSD